MGHKLHIELKLDDSHHPLANFEPTFIALQKEIDEKISLTILPYQDSDGECAANEGVAPADIIYVGEIGSGMIVPPLCFMIILKKLEGING